MTAYKLHNGAWRVESIHNDHLVCRTYYGYTKREALALYRAELRGLE